MNQYEKDNLLTTPTTATDLTEYVILSKKNLGQ